MKSIIEMDQPELWVKADPDTAALGEKGAG